MACHILRRAEHRAGFVDEVLARYLPELKPVDRGLCQELVLGVIRQQATLDWLIDRKTARRPQQYGVRSLLRLGLYQLFFLDRIPDHAAVNETVHLTHQFGHVEQAGFVNALLRTYAREREATRAELERLKTDEPAIGHSHPHWLWTRWSQRWGQTAARTLLEWNNQPPDVFARVNTLRLQPGALLERWRMDENVDYDFFLRDWTGENLVFRLKTHPPLHELATFQEGGFYLQDPSTLLAVHLLEPQPGDDILDVCAAPGGKTTYIAQLLRNRGHIVALDTSESRLQLLTENCARLGVTCVQPQLARPAAPRPCPENAPQKDTPAKSDIPKPQRPERPPTQPTQHAEDSAPPNPQSVNPHPQLDLPPATFDRILVDAPCSNTGVMRRRVELRWRVTPEEILRLQRLQLDLLERAVPLLRPGGVLLYSTCSLEPEENTGVIRQFTRRHPECPLEIERQLLPFADGVDGAYVARMRRQG